MPYPSEGRETLFQKLLGGRGEAGKPSSCVFRELTWSVLGRRCLATGEVGTPSGQPSEGAVLEAEVSHMKRNRALPQRAVLRTGEPHGPELSDMTVPGVCLLASVIPQAAGLPLRVSGRGVHSCVP